MNSNTARKAKEEAEKEAQRLEDEGTVESDLQNIYNYLIIISIKLKKPEKKLKGK